MVAIRAQWYPAARSPPDTASDSANFRAPRPESKEQVDRELTAVTRVLASQQWPIRIHTLGSAWFGGEEHVKGRLASGQYADFAIHSEDH